jgi:hypothetical protein
MNYRDFFKEDMLPGGKGDVPPSNIDPAELAMGIKIEKEHTKDEAMAKEIARDHLSEDPRYYTKLKQAGLADELKEQGLPSGCDDGHNMKQGDKMAQSVGLADLNSEEPKDDKGVVEPNTNAVDKQTTPVTVFPEVPNDPTKGPDMGGGIGSTKGMETKDKTDVESPAKDPQPTDHITGGMGSTPSNPNILSKQNGQCGGGAPIMQTMMKTLMPKDISIDIAEGKKILQKLKEDSKLSPTTKGAATAFGPKSEGFVPAAGDPDKDSCFVKGKRWTVKWGK